MPGTVRKFASNPPITYSSPLTTMLYPSNRATGDALPLRKLAGNSVGVVEVDVDAAVGCATRAAAGETAGAVAAGFGALAAACGFASSIASRSDDCASPTAIASIALIAAAESSRRDS